MKKKPSFDVKQLLSGLTGVEHIAARFAGIGFILLLASLYGFLAWQIYSLSNAQPSDSAVSSEVKSANLPHLDPLAVSQLESLQNHSVTVQSLFDQARNNPFQE